MAFPLSMETTMRKMNKNMNKLRMIKNMMMKMKIMKQLLGRLSNS